MRRSTAGTPAAAGAPRLVRTCGSTVGTVTGTRIWRADDLGGLELLEATLTRFAYRPHAHEEFFIALTEDGLAPAGLTPGPDPPGPPPPPGTAGSARPP